ncbi:molybdenum cofactor guanylyltransferase [Armatimonas sp.]|uniref:molybdenum cofactor guanylyltransferase n=1 Tax=Armatimonas sp. TaxID=1872638 RepID=UPI003750ADC3
MQLSIAILAGGKSQRFGQDKAALFLPGIVTECLATGLPLVVIGRASHPELPASVRCFPDALPNHGPLGGIITALQVTQGPVLALACDLPELRREAILWLIQSWEQAQRAENIEILVAAHPPTNNTPQTNNTPSSLEPLFAIYSPACLPTAEELLLAGRRSLHGLIQRSRWKEALLPPELAAQLHNVNTPDDLQRNSKL